FGECFLGGHLVARDAIGVEAAGFVVLVVDRDVVTELRQIERCAETRRAAADAGDFLPVGLAGFVEVLVLLPAFVKPINRVPLEPANLNRLGVPVIVNT